MTEQINAMFLLVSKFKMIGMLLNVMRGQVQKSQQKTYNKGFPNHSTLINYVYTDSITSKVSGQKSWEAINSSVSLETSELTSVLVESHDSQVRWKS